MTEEWGPWIEHDGMGCPVPNGTYVAAKFFSSGEVLEGPVEQGPYNNDGCWDWQWAMPRNWDCIVFYRIRKPRALIQLQDLIADIDVPEGVPA